VYGPVCTVVWQGSAGDRPPYADLTRHPDIDQANAVRRTNTIAGENSPSHEQSGKNFGDSPAYRVCFGWIVAHSYKAQINPTP
jgi:hypothetical protein